MLAALAVAPAAGCGAQMSTLPPSPSGTGAVALGNLARYPEVYADAQVATVGTVRRATAARALYVLDGGGHDGTRIVLEPSSSAARELGRRVRVVGLFTVTFELGYEILISRITPVGSL
jgi:hypothetical protein